MQNKDFIFEFLLKGLAYFELETPISYYSTFLAKYSAQRSLEMDNGLLQLWTWHQSATNLNTSSMS